MNAPQAGELDPGVARSAAAVRVPASTSNLGSGFDCVGVAIDRWLEVRARLGVPSAPAPVGRRGTLSAVDVSPERDLIRVGFDAACRAAGREPPAAGSFEADSEIPVARGLGSSAAAVVAGAALANLLLELELGDQELAAVCAAVEGHPDNVAPAIFGGATLALRTPEQGLIVAPLEVHETLAFAFAIPDFTVETQRARAVLPQSVPHATAAAAAARCGALVRGLAAGDEALLSAALEDVLHVPYRRDLVAGFDAVCDAATRAGAFGTTLSGSGPTLVAIAPRERGSAVAEAMCAAWHALRVTAESLLSTGLVGGLQVLSSLRERQGAAAAPRARKPSSR